MAYEEKGAWIMAGASIVTYLWYLQTIMVRAAAGTPLAEVPYAASLLWAVGVAIALIVAGHIVVAATAPREAGQRDQRDREINRFGEYVGDFFVIVGGGTALVMALAERDHFWIANVIYLCFVLSAVIGAATKIFAYRRGLPR